MIHLAFCVYPSPKSDTFWLKNDSQVHSNLFIFLPIILIYFFSVLQLTDCLDSVFFIFQLCIHNQLVFKKCYFLPMAFYCLPHWISSLGWFFRVLHGLPHPIQHTLFPTVLLVQSLLFEADILIVSFICQVNFSCVFLATCSILIFQWISNPSHFWKPNWISTFFLMCVWYIWIILMSWFSVSSLFWLGSMG